MLRRLRIKVVCIVMSIATLMLCVILGLVIHFTHAKLESESLQMMQSFAMAPLLPERAYFVFEDVRLPYFFLELNDRGEVIRTRGNLFDFYDSTQIQKLVKLTFEQESSVGLLKEFQLRYCRVEVPNGYHILFADFSRQHSMLSDLGHICLVIGIICFFVFLLLSLLLARWAVRPVEKAWKQQQQFVSDASHELKTPLTVILANADMLQSPEYDEQARGQFISNISIMSRQMRKLVEGLLELARADNGAASTVFSQVDLSALISDALLLIEPLCYERGLTARSFIEPGILLSGSETHLQQAVDILLDNAQKYSYPGSSIGIALTRKGRNHCLFSVQSKGDPISKTDLKNIFKRFYRVDKARTERNSYGLGLSIAESIVQMHKGKIWAESEDGVNTFFVQLPLS